MKNPQASTLEWAYCKVAYMLDLEEVVWATTEQVRAHNIREPQELVEAVLSGEVRDWPKVTVRGLKGLFRVLRLQCNVDIDTLFDAARLYQK